MSVCFECCVLSRTDICDGLLTRPEKSYRLCSASDYDHESSTMRVPWLTRGCFAMIKIAYKQLIIIVLKQSSCSSFCPPVFMPSLLNSCRLDNPAEFKECLDTLNSNDCTQLTM